MGRVIRMPSEADLPPGTVRDFVELLFVFYRNAHRPTLRAISDAIRDGEFRGTASPETIRRMLRGTSIPAQWETVEAVLLVLCELGGWDPDGRMYHEGEPRTPRRHLERAWHRALDEPDKFYAQPVGFSDEPPF